MSVSDPNKQVRLASAKLSRRDWILLPAVGLFTIVFLAGLTELIARKMYPRLITKGEDCIVEDPVTGARGIPHSVCWEKIPEGELTEYRFNSSGYRSDEDFGSKQPGTYRIVMMGTSFTIGMRVPREKTFAALLPVALSQRTGHTIELFNEAIPFRNPAMIANNFEEVLKAKPDLVLWPLTVGDMQKQAEVPTSDTLSTLSFPARAWRQMQVALAKGSFTSSLSDVFGHTRTATLLSEMMYASRSQYVKASLLNREIVWYLKEEPDAEWQKRLADFDRSAADVEAKAKSAGVPLVVVLLPNHVQSAMISMGEWPAGLSPYKFDDDLRYIITSHGGTYIDMLRDIRNAVRPDLGYFPIEGHPSARGHAIFSQLLTDELTSGVVPALRAASYSQATVESGR